MPGARPRGQGVAAEYRASGVGRRAASSSRRTTRSIRKFPELRERRAGKIELQDSIFAEPVSKFVALVEAEAALLVLAAGEVLYERHSDRIVCIEHDRRGAL